MKKDYKIEHFFDHATLSEKYPFAFIANCKDINTIQILYCSSYINHFTDIVAIFKLKPKQTI